MRGTKSTPLRWITILTPLPTAYQWGELAERYEETARAEEAFGWWIAHRATFFPSPTFKIWPSPWRLFSSASIACCFASERATRSSSSYSTICAGGPKEAQCYLHSLRPKVPIAELIEKAQTIDEAWEQAREPLRAQEGRQQRHRRCGHRWCPRRVLAQQEVEDERRLQEALLHCRELRIPYSDRHLRDALLPVVSVS